MAEKLTFLPGWRTFCAAPTNGFDDRSSILMSTAFLANRACASRAGVSTPISANRFMMFGLSASGANPVGRSGFRLASGGGAGGGGNNESNWSLLSWYLSLLAKHTLMTKALTAGILNLVGDFICQLLVDRVQEINLKRSFIFTLLGMMLVGPTLHYWYLFLSKLVTAPGNTGALLQLILDQLFFSPIFLGVFLSSLVTLDGKPSHVIPKLQQDWFSAVVANWQLWIPFQFFNFRYVPQQFQVLASNLFSLIWNVILSYKAHKDVLVK